MLIKKEEDEMRKEVAPLNMPQSDRPNKNQLMSYYARRTTAAPIN